MQMQQMVQAPWQVGLPLVGALVTSIQSSSYIIHEFYAHCSSSVIYYYYYYYYYLFWNFT